MKKVFLLIACTVFFWATLPALTKLSLTGIPNMQVLFVSSVVASLCLLLWLALRGRIRELLSIAPRDLLELCGLGFLGNFLYSALYYESLRTLPSADACIINYLWPVFSAFSASFLLRERVSLKCWLAFVLSFIGVIIISAGNAGAHALSVRGVLYCVAGSVCYGLFNVLNKRKGMDQYLCTTIYFIVTAVCAGISCAFTGTWEPMNARIWIGILWLGVFIDAVAILFWGLALQKSRVSFAANLAYATPAVAMIISFLAVGEPIRLASVLGMVFILGGVVLQITQNKEKAA